jgi:hypothetical protein
MRPLVVGPGKPSYPIGKYLPFTLRGDPQNPLGAFLNPCPGSGRPVIPALSLNEGAALRVEGVSFDTSTAQQDCINVFTGSFLDLSDNIYFGNARDPSNTWNVHIGVAWSSTLVITGTIVLLGSAASFIQTGANSTVYWDNNTGQAGNTPVYILYNQRFGSGFFAVDGASTVYASANFIGSARGSKAAIVRNSVLDSCRAPDQNLIPGDSPMVIQDNSLYR